MSKTYRCYKCNTSLEQHGKMLVCPKCKFMLSKRAINSAEQRREHLEHPEIYRSSHDKYNEVFKSVVQDQKKSRYICPICKTRSVYRTKDGRLICGECLLVIKRVYLDGALKEKVVRMHNKGWSPSEIIKETCLPPATVFTIIRRYC